MPDLKCFNPNKCGVISITILRPYANILLMEEILHQLIGTLSHHLQGFKHSRWCRISSINSIINKPYPQENTMNPHENTRPTTREM